MQPDNAAPPLSDSELADLEKLYAEATPGPWRWNSYSLIMDDARALVWGTEEDTSPDYPDRKDRPADSRGTDWQEQFDAAYEADPEVASVPPHHGDTATGRHAKDAQLIEELHTAFPRLAAAYRAQAARLRVLESALTIFTSQEPLTDDDIASGRRIAAALGLTRAGEPEGAGERRMTETTCLHAALCQECSEVHALLDEDVAGLRAQFVQAAHKLDRWRSVARRWWDRLVAAESNTDAATLRAEQERDAVADALTADLFASEILRAQLEQERADWERRAIDEQGAAELTRQERDYTRARLAAAQLHRRRAEDERAQAVAEGAALLEAVTQACDADDYSGSRRILTRFLYGALAPLAAEHLAEDARKDRIVRAATLLGSSRAGDRMQDGKLTMVHAWEELYAALAPPQARGAEYTEADRKRHGEIVKIRGERDLTPAEQAEFDDLDDRWARTYYAGVIRCHHIKPETQARAEGQEGDDAV